MGSPAVPTVTPSTNTTIGNSGSSAAAALARRQSLPPQRIRLCRRQKSHNPGLSSLPSRRSRRRCQLNSPAAEPCSQTWRYRRTPLLHPRWTSAFKVIDRSLADCIGFWDRATHTSKAEWKAACVRSIPVCAV